MSSRAASLPQDRGTKFEGQTLENARETALRAGRQSFLAQRQHVKASLMFNKHAGFTAKAEISNGGLLSIAALVSTILLTTTVFVHVVARDGKRRRSLP